MSDDSFPATTQIVLQAASSEIRIIRQATNGISRTVLTMELFIKTVLSSSEYIDKSNEEKSIENILLIVSIIV